MSVYYGDPLLIAFPVHLFDQGIDRFSCHLLDIYFIGRDLHIADPGMDKIIKSHNGNILRYPVAFFLKHIDQNSRCQIAVADKASISENKIFKGLVDGRVSKQLKDICLLDQTYVRAEDGKQTVAQYLGTVNKDLALVNVVRFEVGEGIEKKEEDFAAEVAAQQAAAAKK